MTAPEEVTRRWSVPIEKESTGHLVVFSLHASEVDAETVAKRLRSFGLKACAERVADASVPGATLHLPRRIKAIAR